MHEVYVNFGQQNLIKLVNSHGTIKNPCISISATAVPSKLHHYNVGIIAKLKHIGMPDSFYAGFDIVSHTSHPVPSYLNSAKYFYY